MPADREAGFTLIEVLVAFALATLLVAALLRSVGFGLAGTGRAQHVVEATMLAQSVLETMGVAAPLRDGESADRSDGAYRIHAAVRRYAGYAAAGAPLVLYELVAAVGWEQGGRRRSLVLRTLRAGPPD